MKELRGIPASPGIAVAPAFVLVDDADGSVPDYGIREEDVADEWRRLLAAFERARTEIIELRDKAREEMGEEKGAIFDTHLLMMDDPDVIDKLEASLKDTLRNVEQVILQVERDLVEKLGRLDEAMFRERAADIRDVVSRVLGHLLQKERFRLGDLVDECVIVARDVLPSDLMTMNRKAVKGIVLEAGGKTSHSAILARAFEIPAVLGLGSAAREIRSGTKLAVDGFSGVVTVSPDESSVTAFLSKGARFAARERDLLAVAFLPAETPDGRRVLVKANIEVPDEAEGALRHGADGVGLFRSEFLFLGRAGGPPDEDEQYAAYRRVVETMAGRPVTIRTLDIGGDKALPELAELEERNPLLGWRAIRFCLSRKDVFHAQLRAILRASVHGEVRIMFPMISGAAELDEALDALGEAKDELAAAGLAFDPAVKVGIMIEVPSAAMTADILARHSDFFSIGTNDLIQYSVAVDRGNERVAYLHQPFHPAVLRFVRFTIDSAHAAGIPAGMCGEMASDPYAAALLLGLGLDEFSMSSVSIPEVRRLVRSISMERARALAEEALSLGSPLEIDRLLRERLDPEVGALLR